MDTSTKSNLFCREASRIQFPISKAWLKIPINTRITFSPNVFIVLCFLLAALPIKATDGIECGCASNGSYISPFEGLSPMVNSSPAKAGDSPRSIYRVSANTVGSSVNLVVKRIADGAQLIQAQFGANPNVAWGFSPDDDRFVYHYHVGPVHNVSLFSLAGSHPGTPIMPSLAVSTSTSRVLFSPTGKYFFYSALTAPAHTFLIIFDAQTGSKVYQTEFTFASPPGRPGDEYGIAHWGFSPDDKDRTFVYAWLSGPTTVNFNMVNLEENLKTGSVSGVHDESISAVSSFWQFSPCADILSLVTQPNPSQAGVRLFRTLDGTRVNSPFETFSFADVAVRSTASSHFAKLVGTDYALATNSAASSCLPAPATNKPPKAAFTFPAKTLRGIETTFTDDSTDSDGMVSAWLWDFDDRSTSTNQNPKHTFSTVGTFNVALQVRDNRGATGTVVRAFTVQPNLPPRASFTFTPSNPHAHNIVTFTDTSTDDDLIARQYWSFGASTPTADLKVCASLDVTLTVSDQVGQSATTTQTIPVLVSPPEEIFVPVGENIQTALCTACSGDIIRLAAGTYTGGIRLGDCIGGYEINHLTLQGAGPDQTILTGGTDDLGDWVIIAWQRTTNTIRDLTITGGGLTEAGVERSPGGGILVEGSLLLSNVTVSGNHGQGGIYAQDNSEPATLVLEVVQSRVVSNVASDGSAGGISMDGGTTVIKDSEIGLNRYANPERRGHQDGVGAGIGITSAKPSVITGNYIHHNISDGGTAGLSLRTDAAENLIANNRFVENSGTGVALSINSPGSEEIKSFLFVGNLIAANTGGGLFDDSSPSVLTVINSTIADNKGLGLRTGSAGNGVGAYLRNTLISGNDTNHLGTIGPTNHVLIGGTPNFRGNGDYHLAAGSVAIDTGDKTLIPSVSSYSLITALVPDFADILARDSDGNPRLLDGDGDGTDQVDLGYDEFAAGGESTAKLSIKQATITWTKAGAVLQHALAICGAWEDVSPIATSPYSIGNAALFGQFYRLRLAR